MRLSEDFLSLLKQNNEITDVMTGYVSLKKSSRDYVCLCPFHSEKTASCHVYGDSQSFYCFGCGAGGDVITFIRQIERLEYMEAVRFLAARCGMAMPEDKDDEETMLRTKILEMNRETARFYRDVLISPAGKPGWNYLTERELTKSTIVKYGLGYATDEWNSLREHLRQKGYSIDDMLVAGLIAKGKNSTYDRFRGRVMFPIIDRRGNVVGFGGRALESENTAKYLNSEETLVFKKRSGLFSLNFAKNSKSKFLILCEGYMDVIALNQAGFDNAVATLGTAITPEQARLMRQYAEEVVIAYDSDEAGQKATMKAINLLTEAGVEAKVLKMNGAKDPDEYIKKYGSEAFTSLLEKTGSAISYEFEKLKIGLNLDMAEGRASFLKKAVFLLAEIKNPLDRAVYISETARITQVNGKNIEAAVNEQIRKQGYYKEKQQTKDLIRGTEKSIKLPANSAKSKEEKAERGIIAYLFHSPEWRKQISEKISEKEFFDEFNKKLYQNITLRLENSLSIDISSLGGEFSAEETGKITGIIKENDILPYTRERLYEYVKILVENKENKAKKKPSEMTVQELLEYTEKFKKDK